MLAVTSVVMTSARFRTSPIVDVKINEKGAEPAAQPKPGQRQIRPTTVDVVSKVEPSSKIAWLLLDAGRP